MAAGLASAGADVVLTSRHEDEAAAAAAEIATEYGHRAVGLRADVACVEDCEAMVARTLAESARV
jgi:short-subunit dehydrogenase